MTDLLTVQGIVKQYGAVTALNSVSLTVRAGEVLALCGDNGAGKSTLVKIMSGTARPDQGEIVFDGATVKLDSPHAATSLGISTVYQDLALCENLDVAANLSLGRESVRNLRLGPLNPLREPEMLKRARDAMASLSVRIPSLTSPVATLSGGQRQAVAVGRAVAWGSRVIMLDEPTAALGVEQQAQVLDLVRRLAQDGIGVVLISHSLPDVFRVSDRIVVLRQGRNAGTFTTGETNVDTIVRAITGGAALQAIR